MRRIFLLSSLMHNVISCSSKSDLRNAESMLAACEYCMGPRGDFGSCDEGVKSENSQGVESDFWYYMFHWLKTPTWKKAISLSSPVSIQKQEREYLTHLYTGGFSNMNSLPDHNEAPSHCAVGVRLPETGRPRRCARKLRSFDYYMDIAAVLTVALSYRRVG